MMKKIILGILGLTLSLTACSTGTGEEKATEEKTTEAYIGKVFETVSESSLSSYKEELLDLNSYDIINDESNEPSNDILWSRMAISDKGYYYWGRQGFYHYLYFMDRTTGKSVPLCNRPDCEHIGKECNAYFNNGETSPDGIEYDTNLLFYYDGYVYVLGHNGEGQQYLYKLSEDGSKKEQYMKLYKKELTQPGAEGYSAMYSTPEVCIHKGYVYYIIPRETVPTLYRIQLGTEMVEEVIKIDTERPNLYRMLAYGDFVFFQAGTYSEDYLKVDGGIFAYNITNGDIKLVKDDAISTYKLNGTNLYYSTGDGIYKKDMYDGTEKKIISYEKRSVFSVAGNYIYLEDGYDLKVYDEKGEYILTVKEGEGQSVPSIYYGDSDYIFAKGSETVDGEKQSYIFYLDVSEIANGTVVWKHH